MEVIGFIIGFLGYLPPGTINLTVVQISVGRSKAHLWYFILFAALMEFIYCFGSLMGMKFLLAQPQWITALKWSSIAVFTVLGVFSILRRENGTPRRTSDLGRGVAVAILNPLQIPFWLIWGVYVLDNNWVRHTLLSISVFSVITASGTIAILWLYSIVGKKMEASLNAHQRLVNVTIGLFFIGLAVLQLVKLLHGTE